VVHCVWALEVVPGAEKFDGTDMMRCAKREADECFGVHCRRD
jgi:hypothetical protein